MARSIDVADALEAQELFHRNGWTDGLPIVPPTPELVGKALEASVLPGDHVIGVEPVRELPITAEKVAINAVAAGCRSIDVPVVMAAIEAMCDPAYLMHGSAASTGGSAPLVIVNGPIRRELGMHSSHNALANGSRANASIGRTIRLVLLNVLGCKPGELDLSTLGHPGKFAYCIAEDEEDSPWTPLAQERGAPDGVSAVTVLASLGPRQFMNEWTTDPEEICETFSAEIRASMRGYSMFAGNWVAVFPKQLRDHVVQAGWQKKDVREYIYANARIKRSDLREWGKGNIAGRRKDEDMELAALAAPEDLLVVAAGGPAGGFGAIISPWLGSIARAVTKGIGVCIDCD